MVILHLGKFCLIEKLIGFVSTEIAFWMYTGERQAGKWRKNYLEAVLKQDVGFFDTDARTRDIVFSISTDTRLVQAAIGEKVCPLLPYLNPHISFRLI